MRYIFIGLLMFFFLTGPGHTQDDATAQREETTSPTLQSTNVVQGDPTEESKTTPSRATLEAERQEETPVQSEEIIPQEPQPANVVPSEASEAVLRQAALEADRTTRAADSAEKALALAQWAAARGGDYLDKFLALLSILGALLAAMAGYISWRIYRADLLLRKNTAALNSLKRLEASLKADDSITDKSPEEIRAAAAIAPPLPAAVLASQAEDWHDARFLWNQVLRARPKSTKAMFHLALALCNLAGKISTNTDKKEFLHKAVKLYKNLAKQTTTSFSVWSNWGNCLGDLARLEEHDASCKQELLLDACAKHQKAAELAPDNSLAWYNLNLHHFFAHTL